MTKKSITIALVCSVNMDEIAVSPVKMPIGEYAKNIIAELSCSLYTTLNMFRIPSMYSKMILVCIYEFHLF